MTDFVFLDSETRSPVDIKTAGAYKYAKHPETDILLWTWALNETGACRLWSPQWCWSTRPDPEPTELLDAAESGAYFIAWNAFFDRHVWNDVMVPKYGWPPIPIERWLCAQAQAEANCLPGKLEGAADAVGAKVRKDSAGKRLIALLCPGTRATWDKSLETPDKMGRFRVYGRDDTLAMRHVWQACRPLTEGEWEEYHASEHINDRGVMVDVEFARAAQRYAAAEGRDINRQLAKASGNARLTITNHLVKARWLYDELWPAPELQELVKKPEKKEGVLRLSCDRGTRELVLEALAQEEYADLFDPAHLEQIIQVLELIESGNSAAIRKFTAMVNQEINGRVHGQYSFNGAGQTGRFSSRGIQIHNLIRDPVEKNNPNRSIDAIEDILAGHPPEILVSKYGHQLSRLLARLIRPTFIAAPGKILVWPDWEQIEARVLPWLSNSRGGREKLDIFRSGQDVYKHAAQPIFRLASPDDADDKQRQVGKVAELSLGFGGGVGAFTAMGRGYGVYVDTGRAKEIVSDWRDANPWCVSFWYTLWEAAMAAHANPMSWNMAGRVEYLFHPDFLFGTLICKLPDGRWILYPGFRHEYREVEDKEGNKEMKWVTSCMKSFSGKWVRSKIWHGVLAENITQATAASILRDAMVELHDEGIVLHTHDELVAEVDEDKADEVADYMTECMTQVRPCYDGLPLAVSIERGPFYTK